MTTTNPTYEHKGVTITFDLTKGKFTAAVEHGRVASAASLDAMKKRIDDAQANAFVPFDCYYELTGYKARSAMEFQKGAVVVSYSCRSNEYTYVLVKAQVVGVTTPRKGSRDKPCYRIKMEGANETEERTHIPATPEAVEAWLAYWRAWDEEKVRSSDADKAVGELKMAIPYARCGE